ncbi:hypothetical protein [Metabacillus sp. Hm71]|uniref:hypothetical protein n=1 Tax=Metabacillus sp. Hm71 TaxID=3450743 RepID=UPI003F4329B0
MTNSEYQAIVEEKFGKTLKEIMYELCVERDVVPYEGATILDVPKSVFLSWRNKFRFGPIQLQADYAERIHNERMDEYKNELKYIDFNREFKYEEEKSLEGFRELLQRLLEIKKKVNLDENAIDNINAVMEIAVLERSLQYIEDYIHGNLMEKYNYFKSFYIK